ncbi:ABC transporter ATP-binding protein [endosymbiont of unidentified scaly snail isolate Monju]|uniref:ABC transporter ATP-binding protein n=1 Tax=endosymbiont of unidentified scaly snail isolate Monju TaxID=1248727 RepID=UPI00038924F0|nr:ABC transporter ATP-binding protein [endosymbiont of unidentified scaly snail isolate Monju]BAN68920.1 tungstate ABC transporter ATP-binding protein [endosymbiont of unidentified scaly snail isolate Monju]
MKPEYHLQVSQLCKSHGRRLILNEVEFSLPKGSCTLLTGENGAGKTTLLRILANLEKPERGRLRLTEQPWQPWRKMRRTLQQRVMYLHQHPYMFDGTVEYNLRFALGSRVPQRDAEQLTEKALQLIGMESFRKTAARTLSGGERQRVALARAWLRSPQVMLLDEPTANLDYESRQRTLELLQRLRNDGMTLVIASHDPLHFEGLTEQRLHLQAGKVEAVELNMNPAAQPANVVSMRRDYA